MLAKAMTEGPQNHSEEQSKRMRHLLVGGRGGGDIVMELSL